MLDTIDRIAADYLKPAAIHAAEEGVFQLSLWEALGDVGLTTAMLPESAGGLALGLHEVCDMLSRCAYHAMPIPIAETALAIALVSASNPQWTGPLADALIHTYSKEQHRLVLSASLQKEELMALRVGWAGQAQALVLVDEQGTVSWCDRPRQAWQVVAARRNLAGEPREDVRIHAEHISTRSHGMGLHHRFEQMGALVRAAQINGAIERTLQLSIQYANLHLMQSLVMAGANTPHGRWRSPRLVRVRLQVFVLILPTKSTVRWALLANIACIALLAGFTHGVMNLGTRPIGSPALALGRLNLALRPYGITWFVSNGWLPIC
ncbi:MAG: hypothetical protein EBT59_05905 [Betaproteobacteria bacterium]|nr:hypothetical protein [Betaproteobacteria bacterium]